ncbi:MAG TPA: hypothetical protein VEY12_00570, partial [Thermoplasmata archaeon]|nr:hypothetical protein [Thermoplasmata archaeon]
GAIDFQVLGALMARNSGSIFIPSTTSTSVTLGVDGVPIFSSPTIGTLASNPDGGSWAISFQYCIRVGGSCTYQSVYQNASGQIDLSVGNRYYPAGDVVYESGAVIRSQPDGQVIRAAPIFQVTPSATNLSVAFELVNLYNSGSTTGTTTQIVDTNVFNVDQQAYGGLSSNLIVAHTSAFGLAWFNFFNSTMSSALRVTSFTYSSVSGTTTVKAQLPGTGSDIYWITMISNPSNGLYTVTLRIFNSPLALSFTLQQAYVNVGVGQNSNLG